MLELLTARGTLLGLPNRGSPLDVLLGGANIWSERDLFDQLNVAIAAVSDTLIAEDASNPDLSERFARAEIVQVEIANGVAMVSCDVLNASGQKAGLSFPVSLNP
jgi:hypothetical protein